MLFLLLRILTISISKDIVSYKDQRKDNKYKCKYKYMVLSTQECHLDIRYTQVDLGPWHEWN